MGYGGETGIRTLDTLSSIHAFQACAFSHSAISPWGKTYSRGARFGGRPHCNVSRRRPYGRRGRSLTGRLPIERPLVLLVQLLREVVLDSHFADGVQLSLEPVDMVLFV